MASLLPGFLRRKDAKAVEDVAIQKAVGAVAKAFAQQSAGLTPGSSFPTMGSSSALIARVTQNLASNFDRAPAELEQSMARQGLSWGPPFPPGRPLQPSWGYRRAPRTFDFPVGANTQITPRWNRISFPTLKSLWEAYDVAQIATRHLINDVRSLDYHFEAAIGVRDDVSDDIIAARQFFDSPDKRQPMRAWLAEWLMDVLRYDAGALYSRRNEGGDPIALEVVNGTTIIPIIDYYGRIATDEDDEDPDLTPLGTFRGATTPAYVQVIQGAAWDWLAADDMIYQPLNPMPDSQYGLAPLEAVLLSANTDLRFQWHFLQFFTEGSIPAGFMEAPPDLSDPTQIAEWQDSWDALMLGDQAKLRQIRWVPAGSNFRPAKESADHFDPNFPLYLMRRVCAAFGVTPNDLGFTDTVNRATSETQVDVQFRVGTLPIVRHVEDVINLFISESLKLKVRLRFDTGREIEDRLSTAQAEKVYIDAGVISPDEPRARLGYPVDRNRPTPRFINNMRSGPIPILALQSMAGAIDVETFAPARDQDLIDHPFVAIPGTLPVQGSQEAKDAANSTAAAQANLIATSTGKPTPHPQAEEDAAPDDAIAKSCEAINAWLDRLYAAKETAGLTAATGVQGVDLVGDDDDDDEDEADEQAVKMSLRRWRENSRTRLRKGLPPRRFIDPTLPERVADAVWSGLETARTREEIDAAFAADSFRVDKAKSKPVKAAGIAVVARDSGRVLMIQRDNDGDKQASGRWEWPGGRLNDGEDAWTGAKREWEEETGNALPSGELVNTWNQGGYTGHVWAVDSETDVHLNPSGDDMAVVDPDHPKAEQTEVMAWWDPDDAEQADAALRDEFGEFDWDLVDVKKRVRKERPEIRSRPSPEHIAKIRNALSAAIPDTVQRQAIRAALEAAKRT